MENIKAGEWLWNKLVAAYVWTSSVESHVDWWCDDVGSCWPEMTDTFRASLAVNRAFWRVDYCSDVMWAWSPWRSHRTNQRRSSHWITAAEPSETYGSGKFDAAVPLIDPHPQCPKDVKSEGKRKGLDTCSSAASMSQTRDEQCFTISEVAANLHKPMVLQRMTSVACVI